VAKLAGVAHLLCVAGGDLCRAAFGGLRRALDLLGRLRWPGDASRAPAEVFEAALEALDSRLGGFEVTLEPGVVLRSADEQQVRRQRRLDLALGSGGLRNVRCERRVLLTVLRHRLPPVRFPQEMSAPPS